MVERLNGIQEVRGSNPLGSTILHINAIFARPQAWQHVIDSSLLRRNLLRMKTSPSEPAAPPQQSDLGPSDCAISGDGIDLKLLEDSLAKTVWERMLANDDALRLIDLLQSAVLRTRAKS